MPNTEPRGENSINNITESFRTTTNTIKKWQIRWTRISLVYVISVLL